MAGKSDENKNRLDLIPPEFIWGLGEILTKGIGKHGLRNWEETEIKASSLSGAIKRHLTKWELGQCDDKEFMDSHMLAVASNAMMMYVLEKRGKLIDDLPHADRRRLGIKLEDCSPKESYISFDEFERVPESDVAHNFVSGSEKFIEKQNELSRIAQTVFQIPYSDLKPKCREAIEYIHANCVESGTYPSRVMSRGDAVNILFKGKYFDDLGEIDKQIVYNLYKNFNFKAEK